MLEPTCFSSRVHGAVLWQLNQLFTQVSLFDFPVHRLFPPPFHSLQVHLSRALSAPLTFQDDS